MADNTTLNVGTLGDVIATDDIGGVKHQQVKIEWGIDGTATPVSTANPLPISDAGGSLTVDNAGTFAVQAAATLAAETTKVIGTVNLSAAQTLATVTTVGTVSSVTAIAGALPAGNNNIGDVDVASIIPGTGATNLGKAEDAVHADGDVGVMALGVRRDANTTLAGTTGDYGPIQLSALGNVKVAIIEGAGSGGTSIVDAAAFTRATTSITPIGGVVETSAPTVTNGNASVLSLTTGGAVRVAVASGGIAGVVEDVASAGAEEGILSMTIRQDTIASTTSADGDFQNLKTTSVGRLYVDSAVTSVVPGTGATNLGKSEDLVHTSGDVGVMALAVRQDTLSTLVSADGDYAPLKVDSAGRIYTTDTVQGQSATDAAVAGNPVLSGGRASTAVPTAMSADGDAVPAWMTRTGATVISGDNVDDAAFTPATSRVVVIAGQADETATDSVDEGDAGAIRITLDRKVITTPYAHPAGGYTPVSTVSAASTNATSLKGSAGTVGAVTVTNINAAMRYLKFYNKATAPTVGTDTPVYVIPLPGNTAGAGATVSFGDAGLNFSTGIAWALTTGPTVADTGAVAVSEIIVSIAYI